MCKRMDSALEKKMEGAITTLVTTFSRSGKNDKPVIMHSIRVGIKLFNYGYDADVVISGILHDILEDTDYGFDKLEHEYCEVVTEIVKACSFDEKIIDRVERNTDMFKRCKQNGRNALLVKCADLIENMPFISLVDEKNIELKQVLATKYAEFFRFADEIKSEPIFQEYTDIFHRYFM